MEYQYLGVALRLRLTTNHTVRSGKPSWHRVTRRLATSEVIGPLLPSDTVRRYQP